MKNKYSLLSLAAACACVLSSLPLPATAADDTVYGTMQIPYADFYAAEQADDANAFEVDAVSSATANKWTMDGTGSVGEDGTWTAGGLAAGTYNEKNPEGGGTILGVVYPVAISQADLDALGENNYGFTALEETPTAYKTVTVTDGKAAFSKVQDTDGAKEVGGEVTLETQTSYGDYQLMIENYPQDADVYGAIVRTADGNSYPMRSLENLWRPKGEIAWSVGYVTTVHGNNIDNPKYYATNGATVSEITFITLDGYRTVSANVYLPVLFTSGVDVTAGEAGTGSVTYDQSIFPEDFQQTGAVADSFTVEGNTVSYENALPGQYTLTVSDKGGKYGDVRGKFLLTTDKVPVVIEDGKLVAAEGFTEEEAANFIKNITAVTVDGTTYATGKRGTKVIAADGTIDTAVQSGETAVFADPQNYSISVTATGYTNAFEAQVEAPVLFGDINNDGRVNASDASLILKYAADYGAKKFSGTLDEWLAR
ncbi:MAG: hypothetical protein IJ055_10025 [Oscillospiraceae bacterium]|nr:hypothetical protein [Oscillospiraceae bacterium]